MKSPGLDKNESLKSAVDQLSSAARDAKLVNPYCDPTLAARYASKEYPVTAPTKSDGTN